MSCSHTLPEIILHIARNYLLSSIKDRSSSNEDRPPISLIVCDEGHRLKGGRSKTVEMFSALKTPRRIILSGTPIQNDLSEFHAMASFCCPGLLDDYSTFKKIFETPILNSRAPGCSEKHRELGNARHEQVSEMS